MSVKVSFKENGHPRMGDGRQPCCLWYYSMCAWFQNMTAAMKTVCEILTADPEGGPARISFSLFQDLYKYLAQIDGDISQQHINDVINFLQIEV